MKAPFIGPPKMRVAVLSRFWRSSRALGGSPKEVNQPTRASGATTGISAHLRGNQNQALCVSSNRQRETWASCDLVVSSFNICIYTCSFRLQVTPGFQNHQDLFMVWAETQEIFQSYLKLEMSAIGNKARQVSDSELKHIIHKYKIMQMNTHTHRSEFMIPDMCSTLKYSPWRSLHLFQQWFHSSHHVWFSLFGISLRKWRHWLKHCLLW